MKKKSVIIVCFCIVVGLLCSVFYFSNLRKAPTRYLSITEFEDAIDDKIYDFYDADEYVQGKKILLRDTKNTITIASDGFENNKTTLSYLIKDEDNQWTYSVGINTTALIQLYNPIHENGQEISLQFGQVSQYDYTEKYSDDQNTHIIVTTYKQENLIFEIGYTYFEGDQDLNTIQEKMIDYFKDFEKLNQPNA